MSSTDSHSATVGLASPAGIVDPPLHTQPVVPNWVASVLAEDVSKALQCIPGRIRAIARAMIDTKEPDLECLSLCQPGSLNPEEASALLASYGIRVSLPEVVLLETAIVMMRDGRVVAKPPGMMPLLDSVHFATDDDRGMLDIGMGASPAPSSTVLPMPMFGVAASDDAYRSGGMSPVPMTGASSVNGLTYSGTMGMCPTPGAASLLAYQSVLGSPSHQHMIDVRNISVRIRALAKTLLDASAIDLADIKSNKTGEFNYEKLKAALMELEVHVTDREVVLITVAMSEYQQRLKDADTGVVSRNVVLSDILGRIVRVDAEATDRGLSLRRWCDSVVRGHEIFRRLVTWEPPDHSGDVIIAKYAAAVDALLGRVLHSLCQKPGRRDPLPFAASQQLAIDNETLRWVLADLDAFVDAFNQSLSLNIEVELQDRGAVAGWKRAVNGRLVVPAILTDRVPFLLQPHPEWAQAIVTAALDPFGTGVVSLAALRRVLSYWGPFDMLTSHLHRDVGTGALSLKESPIAARQRLENSPPGSYAISMRPALHGELVLTAVIAPLQVTTFDVVRSDGAWLVAGITKPQIFESLADFLLAFEGYFAHPVGLTSASSLPPMSTYDPTVPIIHRACAHANTEFVAWLLRAGNSLQVNVCVCEPLLSNGARLEWPTLHFACHNSRRDPSDVVDLLLRHGANAGIVDAAGRDALFYAVLNGYHETVDLLLLHRATAVKAAQLDRLRRRQQNLHTAALGGTDRSNSNPPSGAATVNNNASSQESFALPDVSTPANEIDDMAATAAPTKKQSVRSTGSFTRLLNQEFHPLGAATNSSAGGRESPWSELAVSEEGHCDSPDTAQALTGSAAANLRDLNVVRVGPAVVMRNLKIDAAIEQQGGVAAAQDDSALFVNIHGSRCAPPLNPGELLLVALGPHHALPNDALVDALADHIPVPGVVRSLLALGHVPNDVVRTALSVIEGKLSGEDFRPAALDHSRRAEVGSVGADAIQLITPSSGVLEPSLVTTSTTEMMSEASMPIHTVIVSQVDDRVLSRQRDQEIAKHSHLCRGSSDVALVRRILQNHVFFISCRELADAIRRQTASASGGV